MAAGSHPGLLALKRGVDHDTGKLMSVLSVGDVTLDPDEHRVSLAGDDLALPLKEFDLLHLLLANAGRVLTRDLLIDRVWGSDYYGGSRTVDVHVRRIRSKISGELSRRLETVRNVGYLWNG